jgi:membrane protein DedA with SNARE-associated domain
MPFAVPAVLGVSFAAILRDLGYAGLALLMVTETVFPPIPSEAILPLAGYLAERGELHLVAVVLTATAGSVFGAQLLYEATRYGGRPFALRFLKRARIGEEKLAESERWFEKRGPVVVLIGRCIPGARSLVSLPAGLLQMRRLTYFVCTLVGSLAWNSVLVGAGYLLGTQWERVSDVIAPLSKPAIAVILIGGAAVLAVVAIRARREVRR